MSLAPAVPARSALRLRSALAPMAGIIVVLLLAAVTTPSFFRLNVVQLVLVQVGLIGITAVGQTLVLLVGGIDLSIGAVISLTSVILAVATGRGSPLPVALVLAVAAGALVGALNAALTHLRSVPPFVATFATFVLVEGVITAWTRGAPSGSIPARISWLGTGQVQGVPVPALVFAVLALVVGLALVRTVAGRAVTVTGWNARAARLSGVPVGWVVVAAYVLCALCAVAAGVVRAAYVGYVDAGLSRTLDLNSVAAAVIGGVALTGGRGRMEQTVLGVVLLAVLLTWLVQLGAGAGAQDVVSGLVILGAVWLRAPRGRPRTA